MVEIPEMIESAKIWYIFKLDKLIAFHQVQNVVFHSFEAEQLGLIIRMEPRSGCRLFERTRPSYHAAITVCHCGQQLLVSN